MKLYCSKCKKLHSENELCPFYSKQLKEHPELLAEAANFTTVAAQYHLITSQTLDSVAQGVNKIAGSNLTYEGTHQFARDIQVFRQLNVDAYSKSGVFSNAQNAKDYFEHASEEQINLLRKKLNGTGQEVDWLRWKQGRLSRLWEKSKLLGEETSNAPGADGETVNRFTGKTIKRITIKAAEKKGSLRTNATDVIEALEKNTLNPDDVLVGVDGTNKKLQEQLIKAIDKALRDGDKEVAAKLQQAQKQLKVKEMNNFNDVRDSTKRLTDKIKNGQAASSVTMQEVSKKAAKGAIIGAAVGLTISSVTNYMKYKNGEITEQEAFTNVGEDTLKSALIGGAMGAVTLFLPGGVLGFAAGMVIGIYLNAALTNILDEVFGKGAYAAILDSSGYVYGMAVNLSDCLQKIENDEKKIQMNVRRVRQTSSRIDKNFGEFDQIMKG